MTAITYPLDFPSILGPKKKTTRARSVVGISAAPFSGIQQVYEFQGQWWEMELSFPIMSRADADVFLSVFYELHGKAGTILIGDPRRALPKGAALVDAGTPVVDGAGQSGLVLDIRTDLDDVPAWLKAGDQFQLGTGAGTHLHRVTRDVNLIAGVATMNIWPRLREQPADDDPLTLVNPLGLFRMATNAVDDDEDEVGNVQLPTIPFVEAQ